MTAIAKRRWLVLGAISVAVAGLHVVALLALGPAWLDPEASPVSAPRMQVRSVVWPVPAAVPPAPPAAALPIARQPMAGDAVAGAARTRAAPASMPMAAESRRSESDGTLAGTLADAAAESAEPAAAGAEAVVDIPVYATRLPPAGHWPYRLQRGLLVGDADLHWRPQADARYELQLQGRVAGVTLLEWASQGQLDAAGVAPERFAVRRRGRDRQAANFLREAGKITFSGPTHELPLLPGTQDRLSWMVQLPGVVAAAPERFTAGASVVLFVAGARGGGDVWTFVVQGVEAVDGTPALKLVREPRRLYDTRAEIWLDPAEHYLPLRVVQTPSGGGAALELRREREPR